MITSRRIAALLGCLLFCCGAAWAQSYPDKPIRLVVPWPPGGSVDIVGRLIGVKLGQTLGQTIVIDNRSGASGNIGMDAVAKSRPDGYTLVLNTIPIATNPGLFSQMPFDVIKDFTPIALIAKMPHVLIATQALPVNTMRELIALAKTQPDKLTYSSAGNGSTFHMAGELFKHLSNTAIVHVPYRGGGPALTDAISGQVNISFPSLVAAVPFVKAGKVKVLAVTSASRSALLPDVPTIAEAGLPGYEFTSWFMLLAPAGTPRDIVMKVNQAVTDAMKSPELAERFAKEGTEIVSGSPEQAAAFLNVELAQWSRIIKERGIKSD
jgi:tripartite-type tricarboxylate transporter receptor subunit TctC